MGWNHKRAENILLVISVLVLIGLIGLVTILLRQFVVLRTSAEQWQDSQRTVILVTRVMELIVDGETGQRGYVLSGDSGFLQPYHLSVSQLPVVMKELETSATGVAAEAVLVDKLKFQIKAVQDNFAQTVAMMKQDAPQARARIETGQGQALMESARSTITSITQLATENVRRTSERFMEQQSMVLQLAVGLSIVVIIMTFVVICFAIRHIRQSRQLNSLIREARSFAESIVETVHHPLLVLDSALKVTAANRSYLDAFHTVPELVIERTFKDLSSGKWLTPELRESIKGVIEQAKSWVPITVDMDLAVSGKRRYNIDIRKLYRPGNHTDCVLIAFEDITEREGMEQKLKDSNQQLSSFAYSVAHDLRAPLRAMQGFSQALVEDFGPQLPEEAQDYAKRIVEAATRMDQLIRDLLDYSRLSIDEIRMGRVNLDDVLNDVRQVLSRDIATTHAEVGIAGPLPAVWGHKTTLTMMVTNLIGNSLKFVTPGQIPQIRIYGEHKNGKYRLWIADNGIGISPLYHEKIFGIFERLHGMNEFPGTGIGLAIVKKGADRIGGAVGVESSLGHGSRFWLELHLFNDSMQSGLANNQSP
ncbi:MAG: CHASE3 domain-containing protein [Verrucomicrobiota bacterium]|nr:CHASE3 domain-containing protein [Verrucomicrobiota bacterium]